MPIDFDALRGERGSQQVPDDGLHTARLERIVIHESDRGESLITEWSDDQNVQWTSWNRFDASGLPYTQDLLDGLGVDRRKLTDENLADALARCEGSTYQVRTSSKRGSQGDRWFINTYIEQPLSRPDATLGSDIPADTSGLPERDAAPVGADLFGDDAPF